MFPPRRRAPREITPQRIHVETQRKRQVATSARRLRHHQVRRLCAMKFTVKVPDEICIWFHNRLDEAFNLSQIEDFLTSVILPKAPENSELLSLTRRIQSQP
jgi:hypothetical protein